MTVAEVYLELGVAQPFDYVIPSTLSIEKGTLVEVPVRGHTARGIVVSLKEKSAYEKLKPILRVLSNGPVLTEKQLQLGLWMAEYYMAPLGKVLKTFLPAGVRKNVQEVKTLFIERAITLEEMRDLCATLQRKAPAQAKILEVLLKTKGKIIRSELLEKSEAPQTALKALLEKKIVTQEEGKTEDFALSCDYFRTTAKTLNSEQQHAFDAVVHSLEKNSFSPHLLYGITGSGKTEVYLQAIQKALDQGKGALILVPEISLTEQTIERVQSRLGVPIAVLHHRLAAGQKSTAWEKLQRGKLRVALGARSAIFAPVQNLGLIIVDEEHDGSYKQNEEAPRYHARDVAIYRAKIENATVVLGSATPSIESYMNALNNRYTLHTLTQRPQATLPSVVTVDMRKEYEKAKGFTAFSSILLDKINERKKRKEQVILFLNRRGFSTELSCTACGKAIFCPHCSVKLAFHKGEEALICHICRYTMPPPTSCPSCNASSLIKYRGMGTERVQALLRGLLPEVRTSRIDADTTRHKGSIEVLLKEFRAGKADVLIGTQMIAKGHHFPEVTLVGVLNADISLNMPDFRAQEQLFQLITQVAGRSGRGERPGEVVIQTAVPDHPTLVHAMKQEFVPFYNDEIEIRKSFGFPPFCRIVKFSFVGEDEERTLDFATCIEKKLSERLGEGYCVHPVQPSGHAKVKDQFYFHFFVRGKTAATIRNAFYDVKPLIDKERKVRLHIDVDPVSLLF